MRLFLRASVYIGVVLAAALSIASDCDDDPTGIEGNADFLATMRGNQERPDPVDTSAEGLALFDVDGATVRFRITVDDIQNVTFAHIHIGGINVAGPIAVLLFDAGGTPRSFPDDAVLVESSFTAADIQAASGVTTLDELLAAMRTNNAYVNVHTTQHPAGEIRGTIIPAL